MDRIYLDHSATTPLTAKVLSVINECNQKYYGNTSSIHSYGQEAKKLLEESRSIIASAINSPPNGIVFTGSGSESNNMAIKGVALASGKRHIITSQIEHLSVLNSFKYLQSIGYKVTYLDVDHQGLVNLNQLKESINNETSLISIQHVNNETGVIQNIQEIAQIANKHEVILHVDAVQSLGKIPIDVSLMKVDLLSASAHKLNGPKGIGFLYINPQRQTLVPLIHGGPQEAKRRAGTLNLPSIAAFSSALKQSNIEENHKKIQGLKESFEHQILSSFPTAIIHSKSANRIYTISSISFPGVESDALLINLDLHGICASAGSACSSGSLRPSHVLAAMNVDKSAINTTLRFSFGHGNTQAQINRTISVLSNIIRKEL